jgi:hypothetical protein
MATVLTEVVATTVVVAIMIATTTAMASLPTKCEAQFQNSGPLNSSQSNSIKNQELISYRSLAKVIEENSIVKNRWQAKFNLIMSTLSQTVSLKPKGSEKDILYFWTKIRKMSQKFSFNSDQIDLIQLHLAKQISHLFFNLDNRYCRISTICATRFPEYCATLKRLSSG